MLVSVYRVWWAMREVWVGEIGGGGFWTQCNLGYF